MENQIKSRDKKLSKVLADSENHSLTCIFFSVIKTFIKFLLKLYEIYIGLVFFIYFIMFVTGYLKLGNSQNCVFLK